jgi:hypothetical protein
MHVLCFTGQLNLTKQAATVVAANINQFQFPPGTSRNEVSAAGFYNNKDSDGAEGGTYWHASERSSAILAASTAA